MIQAAAIIGFLVGAFGATAVYAWLRNKPIIKTCRDEIPTVGFLLIAWAAVHAFWGIPL